jgi:hypothetical protein
MFPVTGGRCPTVFVQKKTDPTLSSVTADTRKGLSLIAPPAAKKRRTIKKVLIEVKFPLS